MPRLFSAAAVCCALLAVWAHSWAEQAQPTLPVRRHSDDAQERRALWVRRDELASPTDVVRMVGMARDCHFTALLVQVRGRDDAYYRSKVVPMAQPLRRYQAAYDPLQLAIEKGHEAGMEVHAWVNLCIAWSAGYPPEHSKHVLYEHPEWLTQSALEANSPAHCSQEKDSSELPWRFLSPAIPRARAYLLDVVTEIVEHYEIDGLHLDYVRYPGEDSDYGPEPRRRFREEFGVDPCDLLEAKQTGILSDVSTKLWDAWLQWRADQVTELVRCIREMIRVTKPHIKLSAAVKPDVDQAYETFGQAWPEWVNTGLVDFVIPMMYAKETYIVMHQLARISALVPVGRLYVGIGLYSQPLPYAVEKIEKARVAGIRAFCLFSYADLKEQYEAFVASSIFSPCERTVHEQAR